MIDERPESRIFRLIKEASKPKVQRRIKKPAIDISHAQGDVVLVDGHGNITGNTFIMTTVINNGYNGRKQTRTSRYRSNFRKQR
jgi:hypothetical protein